ncbi:sodium-dependent transporter [Vibrio sp. JCM 19053]|nr:sodium-dependent transporter [Vibrio sp. JCM 19053]
MTQQTSSQPREHFGSRLGFILAAAGAQLALAIFGASQLKQPVMVAVLSC